MRVAIACLGSQGDVLPLIEIARRLQEANHDVTLGVTADLAPLVQRCGFTPFVYTALDVHDVLISPITRKAFFEGGTVAQLRTMGEVFQKHSPEIDEGLIALCRGADCVITGRLLEQKVALITHASGTPIVSVHFFPTSPYAPTGHPLLGPHAQRLPYPMSKLTYWLADWGFDMSTLRDSRNLSRRIDYPRRLVRASTAFRRSDHLVVEAFGTAIVARNKRDQHNCRRIGFIRPTQQQALYPPTALDQWIDSTDEPLIYLGFGSMPVPEFSRLVEGFDALCASRGYRAVAATGWSQPMPTAEPSDRIRIVSGVDHNAVFPRCTAVVHHGGAGTVASAVASGTPSVVCSQAFDQHFWGRSLHRLGVGELIPRHRMTATAIGDAVERVRAVGVQHAAKRLAAQIQDDLEGASEFLAVFDDLMGSYCRNRT